MDSQMNPYIADLLAQPEALRATLAGFAAPSGLRELAKGFKSGKHARLVLTGMGMSYAALHYLVFRLTQHGFCPILVETSELIYDAASIISEKTLLVVASQSGQSGEIVKLLSMVSKNPVVAITNNPDSPLARGATFAYITQAGVEHSVPCKTYLTALAAMAAFSNDLVGVSRAKDETLILAASSLMSAYLSTWDVKAAEMAERLDGCSSMVLCGRGFSVASAFAGAHTIRDAAKIHAEGLSAAQFRHGHMEMIGKGFAVVVFRGAESTAPLLEKLASDIQAANGTVVVVSDQGRDGARLIPPCAPQILPFLEILPTQLASIGLAWKHGREPGHFATHSKVTTSE
ncbi:MAG: SIS domain-containing protein [Planctomycetes bacterium]|nr:SIS domain-containing protein [Planctomycetota bacterium]